MIAAQFFANYTKNICVSMTISKAHQEICAKQKPIQHHKSTQTKLFADTNGSYRCIHPKRERTYAPSYKFEASLLSAAEIMEIQTTEIAA